MSYIDLSQIEEKKGNKFLKALKEIGLFVLINGGVFVIGMIIINFNAYKVYFYQYFGINSQNLKASLVLDNVEHKSLDKINKKQVILEKKDDKKELARLQRYYQKLIEKKISQIKSVKKLNIYEKNLSKYLRVKQKDIKFTFNLLPPGKRILIPAIGVNAPIIDLKFVPADKYAKGDYDEYLYKGVVKYPYTPDPGQSGNILIFGHTSYYWWKKNPYGDIFAKIPLLRHGDIIEIIWNGKVYKYQIFKKLVKYPRQVKATYQYYAKQGKILTLMGCYPIGTDRQRMLIIAKQIENINQSLAMVK